jgi:4-amino-4-deoxy-L-arabinose transferase-like glycosyltransferase
MTRSNSIFRGYLDDISTRQILLIIVALTAIRIVGLHFSTVDLYYDEAQYWAWSRELALGYFSKPPLLAWIIAFSTHVCGTGEACIRTASPVFYFTTCLFTFAIADQLYDRRTAVWSTLTLALATGLSFSARIISTDVPLICFWSVALLAYVKLLRTPDWRVAIALGIACGLGLLAKYAMIYFFVGTIFAACIDAKARSLLLHPQSWLALIIAALIISPNVYWNFQNHFVTLGHTGKNIFGSNVHLNALEPIAFVVSQLALSGPIVFVTFLLILARIRSLKISRADRIMLAFAIPPLALVTLIAFVRNAHANWAAPSILSLTILVVAWWLRNNHWWLLRVTLAIGLAIQIALLVGDAFAYRITIPLLGHNADIYRPTLGWRELGERVAQLARSTHAATVVTQFRHDMAALTYYLRNKDLRVVSWPASVIPNSEFDLRNRFDDTAKDPVLLITRCPINSEVGHFFNIVEFLGRFEISSGPSSSRNYYAFKLANRRHGIVPAWVCAASLA